MPPSVSSPIDQEYNVNNNEQPIHHYAVGDVGKPEHMADNDSHDNIILAAAHLKPNDLCFVLRSNGQYTYAKVKSCRLGPKAHIELQVDDVGCLKRIPLHLCWKYVRQMSASMQLAQLQAQEQEQEEQHESERAAGLPALPPSAAPSAPSSAPSLLSSNYQPRRRSAQRNVETFTRSFRGAQGLPQRRSSLRKGFSSNPDFSVGVAQQRLSLEALHLESQIEEVGLDLDEPQPRPTRGLTKTSQSTANLMGFGLSGSSKQESLSSFSKESVLSRDNNNNNNKNFKSSITIDHRQLNEELNMALFGLTL